MGQHRPPRSGLGSGCLTIIALVVAAPLLVFGWCLTQPPLLDGSGEPVALVEGWLVIVGTVGVGALVLWLIWRRRPPRPP